MWRELVSSGRFICRCHGVFIWSYVYFVLLRFRLYAFVEATALSFNRPSIRRRSDSHMCFFFFFLVVYLEMSLFPSIFCTISAFSLYRRVRRTFFLSGWCFFYFVTTGWIFYISLCENSINQNQCRLMYSSYTSLLTHPEFAKLGLWSPGAHTVCRRDCYRCGLDQRAPSYRWCCKLVQARLSVHRQCR